MLQGSAPAGALERSPVQVTAQPHKDFSIVPIKAVLFDIDGTLVDSNDLHVLAWEEAFASVGASFERQVIHDQIGKGADMLVPALLPGADALLQQKLAKAHGEVFADRFLRTVKPFPGAHDLLARVHEAGQTVVLASSASAAELEHYLALLDACELVSASTSADDVENTKPAPDIFAKALKKVAPLVADEVLVVGDTPYDIEAAARCGIAAVALRSGGFSDEALRSAGAIALYDHVAALLAGYDASPLGGLPCV
jgi:HAD superfamily hydrolase (TIGR01509 family)